jgi:hypothetical protein
MEGESTSSIGSSMGLTAIVGKHPAASTAVCELHAKMGIFRPPAGY